VSDMPFSLLSHNSWSFIQIASRIRSCRAGYFAGYGYFRKVAA
jgi:hypothetical protein